MFIVYGGSFTETRLGHRRCADGKRLVLRWFLGVTAGQGKHGAVGCTGVGYSREGQRCMEKEYCSGEQ